MSMIGDYIHYHKYNYKIWGTNQIRTSPSENWDSVINKVKKDMNNVNEVQALVTESKRLEKQYNDIFYLNYSKANKNGVKFRKTLEQAIQYSLNKQYRFAAGEFNPDTMSVDETKLQKQLTEAVKRTREKIGIIEYKKTLTAQQFLDISNKLILLINQDEFKTLPGMENEIKKIKEQLNLLKKKIYNKVNSMNSFKDPGLLVLNSEDVRSVNAIIQEFNRVPSLYDQNQKLFEWLMPFIGLKLNCVGKDELKKTIEDVREDLNKNNINIKMSANLDDLKLTKITDIDIAFDNIEIKSVSDLYNSKIFINYTDKKNRLVYNRPELKDFKVNKDINIILSNDSSLYGILQMVNDHNFANHYLNIIAWTSKQESSSDKILEANRMLKSYALMKSQSNIRNSFIAINDSKNNKVNVYSLKALVYLLQNHILSPKSKYSDIINISNSYKTSNKWEDESKEKRINKIISRIQKKQVTARLKGKDFNNYLYLLKSYKT